MHLESQKNFEVICNICEVSGCCLCIHLETFTSVAYLVLLSATPSALTLESHSVFSPISRTSLALCWFFSWATSTICFMLHIINTLGSQLREDLLSFGNYFCSSLLGMKLNVRLNVSYQTEILKYMSSGRTSYVEVSQALGTLLFSVRVQAYQRISQVSVILRNMFKLDFCLWRRHLVILMLPLPFLWTNVTIYLGNSNAQEKL